MVDKIKSILPIAAFCIFLGKILIFSANIAECVVILGLIAYVILNELRIKDKKLAIYDSQITKLQEANQKLEADVQTCRSAISSIKLSAGLRNINHKST
jgi:hypothetical protein